MKFPSITVLAALGFTKLAAATDQTLSFVSEAQATFNPPEGIAAQHQNRYIVEASQGVNIDSIESSAITKGGHVKERVGKAGRFSVVEFDDEIKAAEFVSEAASQNVTAERDEVIYSFGVRGQHSIRNLAEEIPWGIENVFERNGVADIPDQSYFPEVTHKICIIDSGYQVSHPDLVDTAANADDSQSEDYKTDLCKHGSHVAGTIVATDNNEGVIGVFPGAPTLIVKVFFGRNCDWSYTSSLIDAANKCQEKGAKIISMSLGGGGSIAEGTVFDEMYENDGVLIIAAAGNGGNSAKSYPASYDFVMSVGAADESNNIALFSQHNDAVDIAGPGVGVKSTSGIGDGYLTYSGTSMATPHVSGVAFLLWNKFDACTNVEIRRALEESAEDMGTPGRDDYFGHGLVKYWSAVDYLQANPCGSSSPEPTSSPTACQGTFFKLDLLTDGYGSETSWKLELGSTTVVEGDSYGNDSPYIIEQCIGNGDYKFTISDTYGDGICCSYGNGRYELTVGDVVRKTGGDFSSSEIFEFTAHTTSPTLPPNPPPTQSPTNPPTQSSTPPPTQSATNPPTQSPTPPPTLSPSVTSTLSPSIKGTSSGSDSSLKLVFFNNFESPNDWGDFVNGGGNSLRHIENLAYSGNVWSGEASLAILSDGSSGSSLITSNVIDVVNYDELVVRFIYKSVSEDRCEGFALEYKTNLDADWTVQNEWYLHEDFVNGKWKVGMQVIPIENDDASMEFRFVNLDSNATMLFIDDVSVYGK